MIYYIKQPDKQLFCSDLSFFALFFKKTIKTRHLWAVLGIAVILSPIHAKSVEVSAKSALLMNAETGVILYEKNAHIPMYPASTTKMITAMYALEKKGHALNAIVVASPEAVAAVHPQVRRASHSKHPPYRLEFGGNMGIKIGEALSLEVLLYGLMLVSGNDAANVLAEYVSGSVPQFMKELNEYVRCKGCTNTHLCTPHGLPCLEHKTTAFDLAILAKDALKNPLLRQIATATKYVRPASNMQPESVLHQHNALLKPGGKFYYPKAIGIKTGYTLAAGYTLIAAAEDTERKLIAVLLGCEHLEERYRDAIALFESAFNEKKVARTLFSKDYDSFSSPIQGGKTPLKAGLQSDLIVEYFASEKQAFHSKVVWKQAPLPIRQGEKVAEVQIYSDNGRMMAFSPLFAIDDVKPTLSHELHLQWLACKQLVFRHVSLVLALIGCAILAGTFWVFHVKQSKRKRVKN